MNRKRAASDMRLREAAPRQANTLEIETEVEGVKHDYDNFFFVISYEDCRGEGGNACTGR